MVKYPFVLPLETFYDLFFLGFGGGRFLRLLLGLLLGDVKKFDVGEIGRELVFERNVVAGFLVRQLFNQLRGLFYLLIFVVIRHAFRNYYKNEQICTLSNLIKNTTN